MPPDWKDGAASFSAVLVTQRICCARVSMRRSWASLSVDRPSSLPASATPHVVPILIRVPVEIIRGVWGAIWVCTTGDDRTCPLAHWRSGWKVVGIVRVHRIQHGVVEQQCRHQLKDVLADTLGRDARAFGILWPLTYVDSGFLARCLVSIAPASQSRQ